MTSRPTDQASTGFQAAPVNSLRTLPVLVLLVLLAGLGWTERAAADSPEPPTLNIVYNANGSISLSLADGTPVGSPTSPGTVIPPGTYSLVFNNRAQVVHMFHLSGPGVKLVTDLKPIGEDAMCAGVTGLYTLQSYEETFLPNSTYSFQDDYQPSIHAFFSTSGASTAVKNPAPKPTGSGDVITGSSSFGSVLVPDRGVVVVNVGPSGAIAITYNGRPVTSLKPGKYTIRVKDASGDAGFMLQKGKRSVVVVAGRSFVGNTSRQVNLTAGHWFFFPSGAAKKSALTVGA